MSRIIKFRAWDKEKKCLITGDFIWYLTFNGDVRRTDLSDATEDIILMQYTGLKDNNGKEIYEGDIVKDIYHPFGAREDSEHSKVGEIVFESGSYGIKWIIEECKYNNLPEDLKENIFCQPYRRKWEHPTNNDWIDKSDYTISRTKIIGNIHENKDLLK